MNTTNKNPDNCNECGNAITVIDHRTVGGVEYRRVACLAMDCDADYWIDPDGNECDPEDIDESLNEDCE